MNGKNLVLNSKRRGALMLMLFVVIVVGSIIALRLLPEKDIMVKRADEDSLRSNLSHIRQAVDLRWQDDPAWAPTLDSSVNIKTVLTELKDANYLRSDLIKDPTIAAHLWESSDDYYWKGTTNIAANSSFEVLVAGSIDEWSETTSTVSEADANYLSGSEVDDYPHQNKLGNLLQSDGLSLKITR